MVKNACILTHLLRSATLVFWVDGTRNPALTTITSINTITVTVTVTVTINIAITMTSTITTTETTTTTTTTPTTATTTTTTTLICYLEGQGDLVSMLITTIKHIMTPVILMIELLTKSP